MKLLPEDINKIPLWRIWLVAFVIFSPIWLISYFVFRKNPEQLMVPFIGSTTATVFAWYARRRQR